MDQSSHGGVGWLNDGGGVVNIGRDVILLTSGKNRFVLGAGGGAAVVGVVFLGVTLTVTTVLGAVFGFAFCGLLLQMTFSGQSQNLFASFHFSGGAHLNLNDKPSAHI